MKKVFFLLAIILCFWSFSSSVSAQSETTKIDYDKKSNAIDPDTLRGDQKLIFDHFLKYSSEDLKIIDPPTLKSIFARLGLKPEERDRFFQAYLFFSIDMEGHKISCENWEEFEYLRPK